MMKKLILGLVALMTLTFVACDEETITPNTYHINFDVNGGSYVECQEVEEGQNIVEPSEPTRKNATFQGWFLNDSLYNFTAEVDSSFSLLAQWIITDGGMTVVGFEDITLNALGLEQNDSISGSISSGDLTVTCSWSTSQWGTYGSGFTVSNNKDTTTAGFTNQYSCIAGDGTNNSETFAVCNGSNDSIKFANNVNMESIMICNSTYAYLSMQNGDQIAKKFGGTTGEDEDYYKLTVSLYKADGTIIGNEDLYLADFRGDVDYIVNEWTKLDLSTYKNVSYLKFSYESTDISSYGGFNTPAYFCIDNITYYAVD